MPPSRAGFSNVLLYLESYTAAAHRADPSMRVWIDWFQKRFMREHRKSELVALRAQRLASLPSRRDK